jgi:tRNA A37 threonylcarbamoyladenosine modification protein TsaB
MSQSRVWGGSPTSVFAARRDAKIASVASLGAIYYAQGKTVTAAEHEPEYLRKSQAEREREEQERVAKEAQA